MNAHPSGIAFIREGLNMVPQMLEVLHTLGQTTALKHADLDLGHIQPTSMFGGIMHLQTLPNALSLLWWIRLIQAGCCMRIEIIHHQTNALGLRVDLIDQPADGLGKIQPGASLTHLQAAKARQWLDKDKQISGPQSLILVIRASGRSWLGGPGITDFPMHHQRFLVKTDQRLAFIIRLSVQMQDILHSGNILRIHIGNTPVFMLPGFQLIFFSNCRIVSGEIDLTYPNSTALPANIRTVQWSWPASTSLHAMAIRWAACSSLSACRRRSCRLSVKTAGTPPALYRLLTLRIVCSEILKVSMIWALLQFWSHLSKTHARFNVRALALPRRTKISTYSFSSSLSWMGALVSKWHSCFFCSAYHSFNLNHKFYLDWLLESEPFLFCYPAVRSTSQFAGIFHLKRDKEVRMEFYEGKRVEPQAPTSQREKDTQEEFLHFERKHLAKNLECLRILAQIKAKRSPSANHTIYHVLQSHE